MNAAGALAIRTKTNDMSQDSHMQNHNEHTIEGQDNEAEASGPINGLPNEILSHILSFLDTPRDLSADLLDEPRFDLTQSKVANLKAASYVSKKWRQAAFPMVFKHPQFVETGDHWPMLGDHINPFLDFARSNFLGVINESFTLVVKNANDCRRGRNPNRFSSFWMTIFDILDPAELLVVAPVEALAALAACHILRGDAWSFDCPYHYLQLKRSKTNPTPRPITNSPITSHEPVDSSIRDQKILEGSIRQFNAIGISESTTGELSHALPLRAKYSPLLQGRPWSKLLLNEGSFIKTYATYEWWLRLPPSILSDLVGADFDGRQKAFIAPTVRDFSYIGIFSLTSHFNSLVQHLPRLDRLYTQFVPRNEILQDRKKMSQVEATDLWTERNGCYTVLMRELFNAPPENNYRYLKEFESGDAADRDAWNMAVEYVKRIGNGWKVASDGVFVKEPVKTDDVQDEEEQYSIFQGALTRWAFNGTAELPVSAYSMYAMPME